MVHELIYNEAHNEVIFVKYLGEYIPCPTINKGPVGVYLSHGAFCNRRSPICNIDFEISSAILDHWELLSKSQNLCYRLAIGSCRMLRGSGRPRLVPSLSLGRESIRRGTSRR